MTYIRHRVEVLLEEPAACDEVSVESVPGLVAIHFGLACAVKVLHRDADELFELMLNRVRFQHAAQVTARS